MTGRAWAGAAMGVFAVGMLGSVLSSRVPDPAGVVAMAAANVPAPTEHRLHESAERENREGREAWIEEMHRAAPDVDWRRVEQANVEREMQRRAQLWGKGLERGQRWTEVGSRNQAGRMMCAALGPDTGAGRRLYAGAALGGLWRAAEDGTHWIPRGDNLRGTIQKLVVVAGAAPGDPDVVVVHNSSLGKVLVSRNDGATWEVPAGLESLVSVRSLARRATGSGEEILVYGNYSFPAVGTRASVWGSLDRGASFQLRYQFPESYGGWLWVPRGAGPVNTLYAVHQGNLWTSTDGGASFQPGAVIHGGASKVILTGSEAGAPALYAAAQVSGVWRLYRSIDGGGSFAYVRDLTDFWEVLDASPTDPDVLVYGGVEAWRSADQGTTFTKINAWGDYYGDPKHRLHADLMGIFAFPDPDRSGEDLWFLCTDGGVYRSDDRGQTVLNQCLSGLGVGQYYSTLTSTRDPSLVQAGSQDQGYQQGAFTLAAFSGPTADLAQLISGDYGHLTSTDGTHDLVYSTYPGFVLISEGEAAPVLRTANFPAGSSSLWLPPVVAHPTDPNSFFFLGDKLWLGVRSGNSWSYVQHSSRDFASGSGNYLTAMAFAPTDPNRACAVNDAGKLYSSTDGAVTWTTSSDSAPPEHYFYGNTLAVHPVNPLEVFVGGSGYSSAGVRRSTDGGVTWSDAAQGLPPTLVYDLAYALDGASVYAATEAGAYRYDIAAGTWSSIMENGTPLTLYWSVEAVPGSTRMRFGTYGRGIWDFDPAALSVAVLFSVDRSANLGGIAVEDGDVAAFDCSSREISMVLDLSDVLPGNADVDALVQLADQSYLLSFRGTEQIPGLVGGPAGDTVEDEDLVRFVPTSTGPRTAGSFEFYLDGSDVGLGGGGLDVDGLSLHSSGDLLVSLAGAYDLGGGLAGGDEDVLRFTATSLGASTAGAFQLFFHGDDPDVKLGKAAEDVDALDFDPVSGTLTLSTRGDFRVPTNQFGGGGDLLTFAGPLGADPSGTFTLTLDAAFLGPGVNVDALHVLR